MRCVARYECGSVERGNLLYCIYFSLLVCAHIFQRFHPSLLSPYPSLFFLTCPLSARQIADFGTSCITSLASAVSESWVVVSRAGAGGGASKAALEAMTLTRGIGTPLWMAPEVLAGLPYNELVDVYSFGMGLGRGGSTRGILLGWML